MTCKVGKVLFKSWNKWRVQNQIRMLLLLKKNMQLITKKYLITSKGFAKPLKNVCYKQEFLNSLSTKALTYEQSDLYQSDNTKTK